MFDGLRAGRVSCLLISGLGLGWSRPVSFLVGFAGSRGRLEASGGPRMKSFVGKL